MSGKGKIESDSYMHMYTHAILSRIVFMNLHATNKTSCANNLQDTTNEPHKNVYMISDNQLQERNVYNILLVYCSLVVCFAFHWSIVVCFAFQIIDIYIPKDTQSHEGC